MYDDSIYTRSQKEYQDKLDIEVLSHLPEVIRKFSLRYFGVSEDKPITKIEGILPCENEHFFSSEYFDIPNEFYVHFTSEECAYSIIKSGNFRMYNLHNSNDDNELSGASRQFDYGEKQINILKSQIFTLSAIRINNQIDDTELEHHWDVYGDKKKGVAIVFRFLNNPITWKNYHFAKIKYESAIWFEAFAKAIHKWNKSNPFYYAHIPKLLSFHKSKDWHIEQEYRLLYNGYYNFKENKPKPLNSIKGNVPVDLSWEEKEVPLIKHSPKEFNKEIYFLELPLNKINLSNIELNYFDSSPLIDVVGFIIGSKNGDNEKCSNKLSLLTQKHLGYNVNLYKSKVT